MTARRAALLGFWIGLPMFVVGVVVNAVWTISHNALNINCGNFIYLDNHRPACDAWMLHNGYVNGVTVPLIIVGALAALFGGVVWLEIKYDPEI